MENDMIITIIAYYHGLLDRIIENTIIEKEAYNYKSCSELMNEVINEELDSDFHTDRLNAIFIYAIKHPESNRILIENVKAMVKEDAYFRGVEYNKIPDDDETVCQLSKEDILDYLKVYVEDIIKQKTNQFTEEKEKVELSVQQDVVNDIINELTLDAGKYAKQRLEDK